MFNLQCDLFLFPILHFPHSFIYVTPIQVIHIKKMMEVGPEVFKMTFSIRQTGSNEEQASESGCLQCHLGHLTYITLI